MTDRPIILPPSIIRAALDGRVSRVVVPVKPQPIADGPCWQYGDKVYINDDEMADHLFHNVYGTKGTPYGSVWGDGTVDKIWVRETWQRIYPCRDGGLTTIPEWATGPGRIIYAADTQDEPPRWRSSVTMPKAAARLWFTIRDVSVTRIHDLTTEAILECGTQYPVTPERKPLMRLTGKYPPCEYVRRINVSKGETLTHEEFLQAHFASDWDTRFGKSFPWASSPWAWNLEVEVVRDQPT